MSGKAEKTKRKLAGVNLKAERAQEDAQRQHIQAELNRAFQGRPRPRSNAAALRVATLLGLIDVPR